MADQVNPPGVEGRRFTVDIKRTQPSGNQLKHRILTKFKGSAAEHANELFFHGSNSGIKILGLAQRSMSTKKLLI
jgi:hypothetical protein